MPDSGLFHLFRLHQIDFEIAEVRGRAGVLDVGKDLMAELAEADAEHTTAAHEANALVLESTEVENKLKQGDLRTKELTKALYGSGVVSPREIRAMEEEIELLKANKQKLEARLMELWDLVPPAQERAAELAGRVERRKRVLAKRRKEAAAEHKELERRYRELLEMRPARAGAVPGPLLASYEAIRKRSGGVGMALVTPESTCEACGMKVPEKTLVTVKEDRVAYCESCHRILFLPVPDSI